MPDLAYMRELRRLSGAMLRELGSLHTFAWKQGKRGGRYWLPDGKPDTPAFRLYGAKAEKAASAKKGDGEAKPAPAKARPAAGAKWAKAKYEVARDAHAAASAPGSGVPADRVAWLKARMDAAQAEMNGTAAPAKAPAPAPANPPGTMVGRAVKQAYAKLEDRYGPGMAKAVVGAGLVGLPIPVPGASIITAAPVLAVAELARQVGLVGGDTKPPVKADPANRPAPSPNPAPLRPRRDPPKTAATAAAPTPPPRPDGTPDFAALRATVEAGIEGGRNRQWTYDTAKAKATLQDAYHQIDAYWRQYPRRMVDLAREVTGKKDVRSTEDAVKLLKAWVSETLDLLERRPNPLDTRHSERFAETCRLLDERAAGMAVLACWLASR